MDTLDSTTSSEDDTSETDDSIATEYASQDEIDPDTTPIQFPTSQPISKRKRKILKASSLPLVAVLNARSAYNKTENIKKFVNELGM